MKHLLFALILILSNLAISQDGQGQRIFSKVDQTPITDFIIDRDLDAPPFSLFNEEKFPEFKDKAILIYFWHAKCNICVLELAQLSKLQDVLKQRNVEIIAISVGDADNKKVKNILDSNGLNNLNIFSDKNYSIFKRLGAEKVPTSYFIDKNKKIISGVQGPYNWLDLDVGIFLHILGNQ